MLYLIDVTVSLENLKYPEEPKWVCSKEALAHSLRNKRSIELTKIIREIKENKYLSVRSMTEHYV